MNLLNFVVGAKLVVDFLGNDKAVLVRTLFLSIAFLVVLLHNLLLSQLMQLFDLRVEKVLRAVFGNVAIVNYDGFH